MFLDHGHFFQLQLGLTLTQVPCHSSALEQLGRSPVSATFLYQGHEEKSKVIMSTLMF